MQVLLCFNLIPSYTAMNWGSACLTFLHTCCMTSALSHVFCLVDLVKDLNYLHTFCTHYTPQRTREGLVWWFSGVVGTEGFLVYQKEKWSSRIFELTICWGSKLFAEVKRYEDIAAKGRYKIEAWGNKPRFRMK